MKKVSCEMFFAVLWQGIRQAFAWFSVCLATNAMASLPSASGACLLPVRQ